QEKKEIEKYLAAPLKVNPSAEDAKKKLEKQIGFKREKDTKVGAKQLTKVVAIAVVLPTRKVNNIEAPKTKSKSSTGMAIAVFGNNASAKLPDIPDTFIMVAGTAAKA
ncbi:9515_t:CDS:1, partial [Funneliformis geosporum]